MRDGMKFNGYAYELGDDPNEWQHSNLWRQLHVDDHERRAIKELGCRYIGDDMCLVFLCADARVRAVKMQAASARPEDNQKREGDLQ